MNAGADIGQPTRDRPAYLYHRDVCDLLRTLPTPDPPPWLRARVMAAIAEEERRREHRASRRRRFALLLALEMLAFALYERTSP